MKPVRVGNESFVCALSADAEAAVEAVSGTTFCIECRSAIDRDVGPGPVRAEAPNPATGPIAIAGAVAGQALRVEILDIESQAFGHISDGPGRCPRTIPIDDGHALFSDTIRVPLAPMIGVIGVAPAEGRWSTMDCGPFGGNLDTNDVAAGATVWLPVFRPGGQLVVGDVHAVMGDGEIGGQGLEAAARVTLRVGIEPAPLTDAVYLVRDDELMVLGTGPTVGEACDRAASAMAALVVRVCHLDEFAATKLLGLAGHLRIGQQCCPIKSARVAVSLSLLPPLD